MRYTDKGRRDFSNYFKFFTDYYLTSFLKYLIYSQLNEIIEMMEKIIDFEDKLCDFSSNLIKI